MSAESAADVQSPGRCSAMERQKRCRKRDLSGDRCVGKQTVRRGVAGRAGRDVGGMRVRSKEIPGEKNHRGIYVTLDYRVVRLGRCTSTVVPCP